MKEEAGCAGPAMAQRPDAVARRTWPLAVGAALVATWGVALLRATHHSRLVCDEWVHTSQVALFLHGHAEIVPTLTNIPGYHLVLAGVLALAGQSSLAAMRVVSMCFALLCVGVFLGLRRALEARHAALATAQLAFFPWLYPYAFLVYTDILSVALVLAALWANRRGRHVVAGGVLVLAMLVRQNDVVWAGFLASLALWPVCQQTHWKPWRAMRQVLDIAWPYVAVVALFIAYWAWNGSIAFSTDEAKIHPDASFHWGNPFFCLFVAGVLLSLQLRSGLLRFLREARKRHWPWLLPLVVFSIYAAGFRVDNFFNLIGTGQFIHNAILADVIRYRWAWWAFGLIATVAACALAGTRFVVPQAWLLFPFALFYLSASWLIEGRYILIPVALWLALRRQDGPVVEWATLAGWVMLAQYLALGMSAGRFIL